MRFFFVAFLLITYHLSLITASAHSQVQVIKIVPNGFEPSEVTLDNNSTVIFKNDDSAPRWPASNIHPTHDLYPEFDPKREIAPSQSWSLKPKRAGKWNYHDHLKPHLRGTLIVTNEGGDEGSEVLSASPNFFQRVKNYFAALTRKVQSLFSPLPQEIARPEEFKKLSSEKQFEVLTKFAKTKGGNFSWKYITDTYKGEAGSSGNIHDLAHLAGKLIYENKGIGGLSLCTPVFAFGCYHGLLDTAFSQSLNELPQAQRECEKLGPTGSGPYGSCIHGIGHGVASHHQTRDLELSLKTCEKLVGGQEFCYDGVFMEFARGAASDFYSKADPLTPCSKLEKNYGPKYSLSCGRNQPPVLMSRFSMEFDKVAKLCKESTLSSEFKDACFSALGFSLASSQDENAIIASCSSINDNFYISRCLQAAAGELIFQDAPGWQEKSVKICNRTSLPFRKSCHEHIARIIKDYGREVEQKFSRLKEGQDKDFYVRQQMGICYESGGAGKCYEKVARLFSKQLGLRETLSLFKNNENHPEIYARCHEATHYLSRNEYDRTKSIPTVYAQCDSTCHGGCYHGVLEQYLKEKNLAFPGIGKEFPKVCGRAENFDTPLIFNECLHGMGHAAMFVTDMEIPISLSLCDTFPSGDRRERCYSGVFMENSSSSTSNEHPGKYTKADDPFYPCNWLDQKYAKICYRYQSSYFALITNHDWEKTADLCLKVPSQYQEDCFRTIGTNQVGFTQDTNQMKSNCELMPNDTFRETCVKGVVSSFAYRFVGDDKRMADFCANVKLKYQESCFAQMGTAIGEWTRNKKEATALCDKISNLEHSSWCRAAIN